MMNIKFLLKSFVVTCLFFVVASLLPVMAMAAPRLYFDPSSATPKKGDDITITVKIDVETQTVFGADATVIFPSGDLDVKSVSNGGFFNNFTYAQSDGRLELHGFVSQAASQTGSGDYAKLTFNIKKDSGSGAVGFVCSGNDTQILDTNGGGILDCGSINPVSLTYTGDNGYPPGYSEPNRCGGTCGSNYNCAAPLFCYAGYCRNPDCKTDLTCGCKATPIPTRKPTPKPIGKAGATPEVVTLAEFTPFPSSTPPQEELPGEMSKGEGLNIRTFGILTGIGVLIVAIILMLLARARKKNPPKINPPTTVTETPVVGYPPPPPPPASPPTQNF